MGRRRKASLWGGTGRRAGRPGYYARYSDYDRGRRVCRSKHFLSVSAAREWVKRRNALQDLGAIGRVARVRISESIGEFADSLNVAYQTKADYVRAVSRLTGLIGDVDVCDVSDSAVDGFLDGLAKPQQAKTLRCLGVYFSWAVRAGYAEACPTSSSRHSRQATERQRPAISEADLDRIASHLEGDELLVFQLALSTGLDRKVVERLTPVQVDLDSSAIVLRRPKTGASIAVPLHPELLAQLRPRCLKTDVQGRLFAGLSRRSQTGPDGYRDWWSRAVGLAGRPDILFRDLRAVFAARAQRLAGLSLTQTQRLMGHRSPETTARHYNPPDPDAASRLSALPLPGTQRRRRRSRR